MYKQFSVWPLHAALFILCIHESIEWWLAAKLMYNTYRVTQHLSRWVNQSTNPVIQRLECKCKRDCCILKLSCNSYTCQNLSVNVVNKGTKVRLYSYFWLTCIRKTQNGFFIWLSQDALLTEKRKLRFSGKGRNT